MSKLPKALPAVLWYNPQGLHKLAYLFASEYNKIIKTVFYTSGFLFHLKSQQILLHQPQQKNDIVSSLWSMFGETSHKGEDGIATFQRTIYEVLNIKLARKDIYPVYDYFNTAFDKTHYIYYAQVPKIQSYAFAGDTLSWFTFKQTVKLAFTKQTKQDIVVAQRVIEAQERETMHTQYISPI